MCEEEEVILCLEGLKIGFRLNPYLNQQNVKNICNYINKAISLIEKQQKEIEEYKFSFKILESEYKNTQDMFQSRVENSISKDKIRKKIKELEEELSATDKDSLLVIHELENKIEVLKELLGD